MKYLITGGCGFIGSNLAAEVLKRGDELVVFDNLFRHGSALNLEWLRKQGEFKYYPFDIRNYNDVETVIREVMPDVIFHLGGQVAMTTSLQNPRLDFETNTMGTHNLLEAVRNFSPASIILYSSTNKVYGDLEYLTYEETPTRYICKEYPNGFDENVKLNFTTPYGCSKGAADQFLLDYYKMFGVRTVVFRHSSMYGGNQHATIDQGWIGWFCQKALQVKNQSNTEKFTISGTGKQVRDVLHAEDVVSLYFTAVKNIDTVQGNAFNIGGGIGNSLSLLELFGLLEELLDVKLDYHKLPPRESDQLLFVADNKKILALTSWKPQIDARKGIIKMLEWLGASV
jgi:CDP-paratose 2-epimerase